MDIRGNPETVVIVGAGHAGVQLADSLRAEGYTGRLVILEGESGGRPAQPYLPYQRPPLSKDYLRPGGEPAPLPLRGARFYQDNGIELRPGTRVRAIDRATRRALLDDGTTVAYTVLVLATGASNRTLGVPGGDLPGVRGLRTLADAEALRERLDAARSAVVVGAGFVGLEFAAAAREHGIEVTVLEASGQPMGRVLSPAMSDYFTGVHTRMGTDLRLGETVARFEADGEGVTAVSPAGARYRADLVVVGVGAAPRTGLARVAGLETADGIVVDERLRTSDPAIYAIGDCAAFPSPHAGERVRLESVQNATDQARHAARAILGAEDPYTASPWFWSDQGEHRLRIAGLAREGDETLLRGDPGQGRFSVFAFRRGVLTAVESVNRPADHMGARRLFQHGLPLTIEQVRDPHFSLKEHAKRAVAAG